MNLRRTLLAAAVLAASAGGIAPVSADQGHAPAYLSCNLTASTTGGGWTGTAKMKVVDANAVTVEQDCWLQTSASLSATGDAVGEVAGTRTTCSAAGSSPGVSTSCDANVTFTEPDPTLYYCVDVTWTTAGGTGHRYGRCTRRVRFTYEVPAPVLDTLDRVLPTSPAPRRVGITAGLTGTAFGNVWGTSSGLPSNYNLGGADLRS